jgi:hypothetical protein
VRYRSRTLRYSPTNGCRVYAGQASTLWFVWTDT